MSLLPLLRAAGALPLAQLNMRSPGTPKDVLDELNALVLEGLITVEGKGVPENEDQLQSGTDLVKLTRAGTGRVFR